MNKHSFTGNATSDVQTVNGYIASGEDNDFAVTVVPDGKEYAAPLVVPRTNLLLQSNQFATTWVDNLSGSIADNEIGYDGSNDAWLLTKGAASYKNIRQAVSVSGVWTFSVYAKEGTTSLFNLYDATNISRVQFDLSGSGSVAFEAGNIASNIQSVGNGWFRCSATFDGAASEIRIYVGWGDSTASNLYIQDAQLEVGDKATEYIPTNGSTVTRDWSAFGRVQNQLPGICNGTHTHTGAASGSGIAATTITGSGSGATFAYDFDTLGVLTTLTADGAGSGYKVGDKLSIDTTEGHTIEFRLVEGSNAATVSVSMAATKPNKPVPFPVTKMRVEGLTDRTVLFMDERSRYVFPKPTPYLLDTYEGAAAAYSLRRLRSAYTGPAVRVRRASNNDELDIYFNRDGSLDTATLEAFCAGTDGFVKVWYDQGQGGNDSEQKSTASQPKIVASGSIIPEGGKPALEFDGSDDFMDLTGFTHAASDYSFFSVTKSNVLLANAWTIDAQSGRLIFDGRGSSQGAYLDGSWRGTAHNSTVQQLNAIFAIAPSSGTSYLNGSVINTGLAYTQKAIGGTVRLGRNSVSSTNNWLGTMQEIVLYASDQTSNRTGIETNINDFYNIY